MERETVNILAIDLGTQCGWALGTRDGQTRGGSESFAAKSKEGPGLRWLKFRAFLATTEKSVGEIQAIYFEDVKRHGPGAVLAAHAYGGFRAVLEMWCSVHQIRLVPVGVGTIKKCWTGKGNAKKDEMIAEARRRGHVTVDDNHADALAILSLARMIEAGKVRLEPKAKKKAKAKKPMAPQSSLFAGA